MCPDNHPAFCNPWRQSLPWHYGVGFYTPGVWHLLYAKKRRLNQPVNNYKHSCPLLVRYSEITQLALGTGLKKVANLCPKIKPTMDTIIHIIYHKVINGETKNQIIWTCNNPINYFFLMTKLSILCWWPLKVPLHSLIQLIFFYLDDLL